MKECDNSPRKIHISSNFILSISLLIMFDTLLLRPSLQCNTPLHFTTLHPTTLHYTLLHFTALHPTTLHYTPLHFTQLHFTTLRYTSPNYTSSCFTQLCFTTLCYTSPSYTSLHFTTLHPTTLHYTYRHFTSSEYISALHACLPLSSEKYTPLKRCDNIHFETGIFLEHSNKTCLMEAILMCLGTNK